MKPKILISTAKSSKQNYIDAIEYGGGLAFAEFAPKLDLSYDGLLLCGGGDLNPKYYNQLNNGSDNIDDIRDNAEFALAKAYIKAKKPVFGICRGLQLINVVLGGTLIQHLDTADIHRSHDDIDLIHKTKTLENSIIYKLFGSEFNTNSSHHQAVESLGTGLTATQWSENGNVIEAVEHLSLPVFGVQWHPERMCCSNLRSDTVDTLSIFKYFIRLCNK